MTDQPSLQDRIALVELKHRIEAEHQPLVALMDCVVNASRDVGYPYVLLLKTMDDEVYERLNDARLASGLFWKKIQDYCKQGVLGEDFWEGAWKEKGGVHLTYVEPLDIVNWYKRYKNCPRGYNESRPFTAENAHYVNGLEEDEFEDNRRRPGRYPMLQKKCKKRSRLDVAHKLKAALGSLEWDSDEGQKAIEGLVAAEGRPASDDRT